MIVAASLCVLPSAVAGAQSSTPHSSSSKTHKTPASRAHKSTTTRKSTPSHAASTRATVPSMSGAWKSVYGDSDVALSLDSMQTKRMQDGSYDVRLKWQYASDKPIGRNQSYRTLVEHRLVNCTLLGSKPVTAQTFNVAGKPVSSFTSSPRELSNMDWGVRRGGTSGSKAYAALCGTLR